MFRFFSLILIVASIMSCKSEPKYLKEREAKKPQKSLVFEVGQKYSFKPFDEHPDPHFIVCAIDQGEKHQIVSLYFGGLRYKNPHNTNGYGETIKHAAIDAETLRGSDITLIAENVELPDFESGYNAWKKRHAKTKGSYFAIPPRNVVDYIATMILKTVPPEQR